MSKKQSDPADQSEEQISPLAELIKGFGDLAKAGQYMRDTMILNSVSRRLITMVDSGRLTEKNAEEIMAVLTQEFGLKE